MAQDDEVMADATAGADANGSGEVKKEKQRLRLVRQPIPSNLSAKHTYRSAAPRFHRHGGLIRLRARGPHPRQRAALHDHEKVRTRPFPPAATGPLANMKQQPRRRVLRLLDPASIGSCAAPENTDLGFAFPHLPLYRI